VPRRLYVALPASGGGRVIESGRMHAPNISAQHGIGAGRAGRTSEHCRAADSEIAGMWRADSVLSAETCWPRGHDSVSLCGMPRERAATGAGYAAQDRTREAPS